MQPRRGRLLDLHQLRTGMALQILDFGILSSAGHGIFRAPTPRSQRIN